MVFELGQRATNIVHVKYIGGNFFFYFLILLQLDLYDLDVFQVELVCALSYYTNPEYFIL